MRVCWPYDGKCDDDCTLVQLCSHGMMVNEAASARICPTIFSVFLVNQMLSPGPAREGCLPKVRLMHLITLPWC